MVGLTLDALNKYIQRGNDKHKENNITSKSKILSDPSKNSVCRRFRLNNSYFKFIISFCLVDLFLFSLLPFRGSDLYWILMCTVGVSFIAILFIPVSYYYAGLSDISISRQGLTLHPPSSRKVILIKRASIKEIRINSLLTSYLIKVYYNKKSQRNLLCLNSNFYMPSNELVLCLLKMKYGVNSGRVKMFENRFAHDSTKQIRNAKNSRYVAYIFLILLFPILFIIEFSHQHHGDLFGYLMFGIFGIIAAVVIIGLIELIRVFFLKISKIFRRN